MRLSWILILAAAPFGAPSAGEGPWADLRREEGLHLRGGSSHLALGPYLVETSGGLACLLLEQGRPVARGVRESAARIAANPEASARLQAVAARAEAALAQDLATGREAGSRSRNRIAALGLLVLAAERERAGSSPV